MLGAQLAQCSRTLASSSSARAGSLHTSAVLQAVSTRTRRSQRTLKANVQRREELERQAQQNRPHVVLGHKAGHEAKWQNSDLAQVLITEEDIRNVPKASVDPKSHAFHQTTFFNYGIGEKEKELLFDALPKMTVQGLVEVKGPNASGQSLSSDYQIAETIELGKSVWFARLVDLRNANARGIAYENRRRIVAAFSEPENPTDTGRPEVQAALVTYQIRKLWEHLGRCKKDIANRRSLRKLVHKRAKILRYLKSVDEDRYDRILERLGLERSAVEGELVV
ncbi:S15/NS1 RNA-binding domain-containing protein [Dichomitus squalens LYAD-421 SS1]|uniref:S15/NS1 RNA-binding domain-containing protein n=1 Tax=Dichomitus squalens (strain LYAD-421) TaxID=732165 RepID=UPI0004415AF7|nr:S15/NS1 RNA-binding domain-containing protein [Dichomitus squalens LYAD-421 SS1]EJF67376.1 S15/NS1 RNA-binding domain-containing protein [Dichomitus squalens LYAD-421 SS1]